MFTDCLFQNLTGVEGAVMKIEGRSKVKLETTALSTQMIWNNVAYRGLIMIRENSLLEAEDVFIAGNNATLASVIYISNSTVTFNNVRIFNNNANQSASIVVVNDGSFTCATCFFFGNIARDSPVIFASQNMVTNMKLNLIGGLHPP